MRFWVFIGQQYFLLILLSFYITAQSRRSCWTRFSISLRAFTYPLPSVRSWNKFRMTLGGSCYFYTHFGEANSILMSNLIAHNSLLTTQKSVVSVSSACHSLHLSKNKKKRFWGEGRICRNVQPSYNQADANSQNYLWKHTKKRLKCFWSFT